MSKYFKQDSELLQNYSVTEEDSIDATKITPSTDNLTQPLSEETKQKLAIPKQEPATTEEYIQHVHQQTEQVSKMIKTYSEESKNEMIEQFEKFTPLQMFEKINQLFFAMTTLTKRVGGLEQKIDLLINATTDGSSIKKKNNEEKVISRPEELYALQQRMEKGLSLNPQSIPEKSEKPEPKMDINDVKKKLNAIKSGKDLPDEGFTDKSVNLEEMFPNLDDEALQAAYSAMNSGQKTVKTKEDIQPGNMKKIVGF